MQDRVIVVTGALGALGSAVVSHLKLLGARVVGIDFAEGASGADLMLGGVDASDPESAGRAFARIAEQYGAIDGLVNIVGGFVWETVADGSVDSWDRMYRINLRTALVMAKEALAHLKSPAGIVNVGAAAASRAELGMGAYAAAKAGVARLTEALSQELLDRHIRVNAILPSIIDTPVNRQDMPDADHSRWVAPTDVARVIAFLLSQEAAAVTGALVPVRGRV